MDPNSLFVTKNGERKSQPRAPKVLPVYECTYQRPLQHLIVKLDATQSLIRNKNSHNPPCGIISTQAEMATRNFSLTCVKDVASLTENGTSRTLARVLASSVFPVFWLLKGATKIDKSPYLNQLALYKENCHIERCNTESGNTHRTRILLFSNVGAAYRS